MIAIAPEKVFFVIVKARAFDAAVEPEEPEDETLPDEEELEQLAEEPVQQETDPVYEELVDFIDALNEEEQINLVALAWVGRGDFTSDDWEDAVAEATDARSDHTASYLLGMPLLSDYLEEGLAQHGYDLEDLEAERL